jgi:hypothetical protein
MPDRRMFIVAGPPGGGESSLVALADFAENAFNARDRTQLGMSAKHEQ